MTVWELMGKLSERPAGDEVYVMMEHTTETKLAEFDYDDGIVFLSGGNCRLIDEKGDEHELLSDLAASMDEDEDFDDE